MKRATTVIGVLALGLAAAGLSGCHTVEGAGRDTAALGSGIAVGAEETREHSAQQPGPGNNTKQPR